MSKSQYDAVILNMGGSRFTGYYKKGINLKLSDGATVINIWKPECCPYYDGEVYKDSVIEVSGSSTNVFTYQDMLKIQIAIEAAIDYLNAEKDNLIERDKVASYEHIPAKPKDKKKTSALKFADLEIGGIYLDEKKKQWVFLGQGTLLESGRQSNRSNDGVHYTEYMYLEYFSDSIEQVEENTFKLDYHSSWPDSYASKKRFFEKIGQLDVVKGMPIIFNFGPTTYEAYPGVKPKTVYERIAESKGISF